MSAAAFARDLLGWKRSPREDGKPKNKVGWEWVPNCADVDSKESISLAAGMLTSLGLKSPGRAQTPATAPPRNPGTALENRVQETLEAELPRLDGNRQWQVIRGALITRYAQYRHLTDLDDLIERYPNLRVTLGKDYLIKPDVTVGLLGTPTRDELPFLHAAVSCKWTIRSDRVQNIRHEFNQMARHRRGRQPHL
ncbi:MAG TPA: NgoMIV family type II restriction endonuclease, partial [Pseudonocardiaceae bacterium]|nr:NgoMIV family type II restriction endonuclease [Pseudonocardiaceae bacterium]